MDNDSNQTTKATQEFLKEKKWDFLQMVGHWCQPKTACLGLQLKVAALNAQQSISREESQQLVMFTGSRVEPWISLQQSWYLKLY